LVWDVLCGDYYSEIDFVAVGRLDLDFWFSVGVVIGIGGPYFGGLYQVCIMRLDGELQGAFVGRYVRVMLIFHR
jgi:hypothetical protein